MTGKDPNLQTYLKEICRFPLLSPEEERELAKRAARGDAAAREKLVQANLRLVVAVSKQYRLKGMAFADVIAEGNLGLLRAIEKYDPNTNYRFSTYATWWIRQHIRRSLSRSARPLRRPSYVLHVLLKVRMIQDEEYAKTGRYPTLDEIEKKHFKSPSEKRRFRRVMKTLFGTKQVTLDMFDAVSELIPDDRTERPDEAALTKLERENLHNALVSLNDREATLLRMRYGIGYERPMTLVEIGKKFKITRERARQLEAAALRKLHRFLKRDER